MLLLGLFWKIMESGSLIESYLVRRCPAGVRYIRDYVPGLA
jgi:hypothetical protein